LTYNLQVAARLTQFLQTLPNIGDKHGWKKKAASILGFDHSQNLQPYLNGDQLPGNTLLARLHKLGCDIRWLLYDYHESNVQDVIINLMHVPVYASVTAGTKKNVVMENPIGHIAIPRSNDDTLFGVKIKGDSMSPIIPDGSVVICSKKESVANGKPHLVSWNDGENALRIVHQEGSFFTFSSTNAEKYPPLRVHKKDIHFLHRVVKVMIDL
jgi:SOS-response transcriptional repressor LexA